MVDHVFIPPLHTAGYMLRVQHGNGIDVARDSGVPLSVNGRETIRHSCIGQGAFQRNVRVNFLEFGNRLHRPCINADRPSADKVRHAFGDDQALARIPEETFDFDTIRVVLVGAKVEVFGPMAGETAYFFNGRHRLFLTFKTPEK